MKQAGHAGPYAILESRFLMYDLIKITSRKSSSKIITFYFRIPLLQDYNFQVLEQNIIQQLDQKPTIKYQFAFKRKVSHIKYHNPFHRTSKRCLSVLNSQKKMTLSNAFQVSVRYIKSLKTRKCERDPSLVFFIIPTQI